MLVFLLEVNPPHTRFPLPYNIHHDCPYIARGALGQSGTVVQQKFILGRILEESTSLIITLLQETKSKVERWKSFSWCRSDNAVVIERQSLSSVEKSWKQCRKAQCRVSNNTTTSEGQCRYYQQSDLQYKMHPTEHLVQILHVFFCCSAVACMVNNNMDATAQCQTSAAQRGCCGIRAILQLDVLLEHIPC